jgi:hypothetical protein
MQAAVKVVTDALAVVGAGGSKPNDKDLQAAMSQLTAGGLLTPAAGKLGPKIERLKKALGIRTASIRGAFTSSGSEGVAPIPGAKPQGPVEYDYDPATGQLKPRG